MTDDFGPMRYKQTELTAPGWPRPIVDGWPVPWISPQNDLSTMDAARKLALLDTRTCQVCGVCHNPGDTVYLCVNMAVGPDGVKIDRPEDATHVTPMDEGIMHERCVRLAVKRCPQLVELKKMGRLLVLKVPVEDVSVRDEEQFASLERSEVVDV